MEDKKMKQSIVVIAILLLLCWRFLISKPIINDNPENGENSMDILPCKTDYKIHQDEDSILNSKLNDTGDFVLMYKNYDSIFPKSEFICKFTD